MTDVTMPREYAERLLKFIEGAEDAGYGVGDKLALALSSPPPPSGLREALDESTLALKWAATVIRPGSDLRDAMDAALAKAERILSVSPDDGWVPTHKHLKTGNLYRIVRVGVKIERDWSDGVLYETPYGQWIVRDKAEFFDGRFEALPDAPPIEGTVTTEIRRWAEAADDGWVKVDESHPLPHDLQAGDMVKTVKTATVLKRTNDLIWVEAAFSTLGYETMKVEAPTHYRRRPSTEQGG
jgi:hypothetical protein